jgi:hypothetical protein
MMRSAEIEELSDMLDELMLPDDIAELRQFVELCRKSLAIRSWLFARFANEATTRSAFRKALTSTAPHRETRRLWSPNITSMVLGHCQTSASQERPYGGLSKTRILALIIQYQYEQLDLKTFLLVRVWMRFIATGKTEYPVSLVRVTVKHWKSMIGEPSGHLLREASTAVSFFHARSKRTIGEADFGHNNSWKIHLLLHILDCPRANYRVVELQAGLPAKYQHVEQRLIRRFCQRHGIRRDTKPGRPPDPANAPACHRRTSASRLSQRAIRHPFKSKLA